MYPPTLPSRTPDWTGFSLEKKANNPAYFSLGVATRLASAFVGRTGTSQNNKQQQRKKQTMATLDVVSYVVFWDIDGHFGNIQLNLSNNTGHAIGGQTPPEMHMLLDILRNEKPIRFNDVSKLLSTGFEAVGEGE
jgi:hypothetical protein